MLPLPLNLRVGGFDLHQLKRTADFALYEQRQKGTIITYEIICIQKRPAQMIMDKPYPAREGYPSSEQWGKAGWTCVAKADAETRFAALVEYAPAE